MGGNSSNYFYMAHKSYGLLWTASHIKSSSYTYVWYMDNNGNMYYYNVNYDCEIRPTVNLRADTLFKKEMEQKITHTLLNKYKI